MSDQERTGIWSNPVMTAIIGAFLGAMMTSFVAAFILTQRLDERTNSLKENLARNEVSIGKIYALDSRMSVMEALAHENKSRNENQTQAILQLHDQLRDLQRRVDVLNEKQKASDERIKQVINFGFDNFPKLSTEDIGSELSFNR